MDVSCSIVRWARRGREETWCKMASFPHITCVRDVGSGWLFLMVGVTWREVREEGRGGSSCLHIPQNEREVRDGGSFEIGVSNLNPKRRERREGGKESID